MECEAVLLASWECFWRLCLPYVVFKGVRKNVEACGGGGGGGFVVLVWCCGVVVLWFREGKREDIIVF